MEHLIQRREGYNADGSPDIVLGSEFNDWHRKDAASLVWLQNDGRGNFTTWQIARPHR